jgi:preprotein translocase subunit SecF
MGSRYPYGDIVNLSMNQVLMRSLNTSLAAVLPVLSLLVVGSWMLGAVALQDFALALLIGLITGSYSSIFIATPILAVLKEREPKYKAIRERAERAGSGRATGSRLAAEQKVALALEAEEDAPSPGGTGGRADAGADGNGSPAGTKTAARSTPPTKSPGGGFTHPPRPRKKKKR